MDGQSNIPKSVEDSIHAQIAYHEQKIKDWKFTLKMLKDFPPPKIEFMPLNAPLTRDMIRTFMRNIKKPIRTIDTIEIIYPAVTGDKKSKLIKTLSVIFNILEKEGEITKERKDGIKGNFYKWVTK